MSPARTMPELVTLKVNANASATQTGFGSWLSSADKCDARNAIFEHDADSRFRGPELAELIQHGKGDHFSCLW